MAKQQMGANKTPLASFDRAGLCRAFLRMATAAKAAAAFNSAAALQFAGSDAVAKALDAGAAAFAKRKVRSLQPLHHNNSDRNDCVRDGTCNITPCNSAAQAAAVRCSCRQRCRARVLSS